MGFPCEFTIPVSGPWQERQSSAAKRAGDLIDKASATITNAKMKTLLRPSLAWGIVPWGRVWCDGFTMGVFAGSDWGKMRMIMTNQGYFVTPSQFSSISADSIAGRVPQYATLVGLTMDKSSVSP
jgi:hypothetical protein